MTGTLTKLGSDHKVIAWDTTVPETMSEAIKAFEESVRHGDRMFDTSSPAGGIGYDPSKGFDPEVESLTITPLVVGG